MALRDDPDNRPADWPWEKPLKRRPRPSEPIGRDNPPDERERYDAITAPPERGPHRNGCPCETCYQARMASWDEPADLAPVVELPIRVLGHRLQETP